jgi:hypothetical protein
MEVSSVKKSLIVITIALGVVLVIAAACGSKTGSDPSTTGKVIKAMPVGNLTATISNDSGVLKHNGTEFFVSFKDSSGKTVEVEAVGLTFIMPAMGTMPAMNSVAAFTSTGTPGVYHGKVNLESAGDWQAQLSYEGAAGKGKSSVTVTAQ